MAAKSKKRLCKNENKLLKLEKLEIRDVICSICQSILIEPVTLPCFHDFCQCCFRGSIENNALCCPLCRLRIGSWVRTATKQKTLVNVKLWNFIQSKFSQEINKKNKGEHILGLSPEKQIPRLSKPGEIRTEYEAELQRLRAERLKLEQKHINETVVLIQKLNKEEEEAHKKYLESLKRDELLAKQLYKEETASNARNNTFTSQSKLVKKKNFKLTNKAQAKCTTIESYLAKRSTPTDSLLLRSDTNLSETPNKDSSSKQSTKAMPEVQKLLNNFIEKKTKDAWNKENGKSLKSKDDQLNPEKEKLKDTLSKTKNGMQSLLVSLPLPATGILQHKVVVNNRNIETGSVDSMQQELCFFKPIESTTPCPVTNRGLPVRVPGVRVDKGVKIPSKQNPPSRAQYLESLCHLRHLSMESQLPSAFVLALSILQSKTVSEKVTPNLRSKFKRSAAGCPNVVQSLSFKKNRTDNSKQHVNETRNAPETFLRRTRSMGNIAKFDIETTPKKKTIERKVCSEKKIRLRSDIKKYSKKDSCSPSSLAVSLNNNKVSHAVKNLSSPLGDCDVKQILQEQLRIEKIIQQEKRDYELACKMNAEWNGRRQPRRAASKRQVTLNYALRPAKKIKV